MLDAMPGPEPPEVTEVINIDFSSVPGVMLGKPVYIGSPSPQEVVPEEKVRGQFTVVPGIASNVLQQKVSRHVACFKKKPLGYSHIAKYVCRRHKYA